MIHGVNFVYPSNSIKGVGMKIELNVPSVWGESWSTSVYDYIRHLSLHQCPYMYRCSTPSTISTTTTTASNTTTTNLSPPSPHTNLEIPTKSTPSPAPLPPLFSSSLCSSSVFWVSFGFLSYWSCYLCSIFHTFLHLIALRRVSGLTGWGMCECVEVTLSRPCGVLAVWDEEVAWKTEKWVTSPGIDLVRNLE